MILYYFDLGVTSKIHLKSQLSEGIFFSNPSRIIDFSHFFHGEVPGFSDEKSDFRRPKVLMPGPEIRSGGPLVASRKEKGGGFEPKNGAVTVIQKWSTVNLGAGNLVI